MKIIHTSDWHLGQEFYSYDRTEEHESFLCQLRNIVEEEQPDALVISGDIYHNATPSNTIMRLFSDHLDRIRQACPSMLIVVIAGNHDSASRLEISSTIWAHLNVHIIGRIERNQKGEIDFRRHIIPIQDKGYIVALPHVFPQNYPLLEENTPREERQTAFLQAMDKQVKDINTEKKPIVVAAHMAISGSDTEGHDLVRGNMDFVDADKLNIDFDYLALGHIHCPQNIKGSPARYCGTPIPVSFDENYPHSISIVTLSDSDKTPQIRTIEIDNPWPLKTIPKEAIPFEEAIEQLHGLSHDEKCYIRLHVQIDHHAPANAMEQVHLVTKGKAARFCCFKWEQKKHKTNGERQVLDVEQIKQLNPVEVAMLYYREKCGEEMNEKMQEMLQGIIQEIEQTNN